MIDLAAARETFEGSADFTVGIEEEFALVDPQTLLLDPALRGAARRRRAPTRCSSTSIAGELISSEIEIRSGAGSDVEDARAPPGRRAPAAVRARARARRRARRDRHAPAERLPRAAHHRHRALPPRRGGAEVRRLAQQHVLASTSTSASSGADRAVRVCDRLRPVLPLLLARQRQLALHRRPRLRPALRPQPDVHEVVPALRHPGRVRLLAARGPTTSSCWCAPARSSSSPSCGGRCARTTTSAPSRCASATPR